MKFSGQLLGISNLDRERNQSVKDALGVQNIVQEIEEYQHLTENGQKQDARAGIREEKYRTPEGEMNGLTLP
jgi:hypothetical protein